MWIVKSAFTQWQNIVEERDHPCNPPPSSVAYQGAMCCKPAWQIMSTGMSRMEKNIMIGLVGDGGGQEVYKKLFLWNAGPLIFDTEPSKEHNLLFPWVPGWCSGTLTQKRVLIEAQPGNGLWLTLYVFYLPLFPPRQQNSCEQAGQL